MYDVNMPAALDFIFCPASFSEGKTNRKKRKDCTAKYRKVNVCQETSIIIVRNIIVSFPL